MNCIIAFAIGIVLGVPLGWAALFVIPTMK